MNTLQTAYEAPRLEVKQLRDLPSALACSGNNCQSHGSNNNNNSHNNNNNNNNHNNNNNNNSHRH